jgi:hypothetical protein
MSTSKSPTIKITDHQKHRPSKTPTIRLSTSKLLTQKCRPYLLTNPSLNFFMLAITYIIRTGGHLAPVGAFRRGRMKSTFFRHFDSR